jgi:hypothetical protein
VAGVRAAYLLRLGLRDLGPVHDPQPGAVGLARGTCTRTPVLSAERVEVSARSSNRTVGSGVSTANVAPASAICWQMAWIASRPVTGWSAG